MCGIAGFLDRSRQCSADELLRHVTAMSEALRHRGPDDQGAWTDPEAGVAFGHRRLSIIDLTAEGHQPMHSATGNFVVIFNGEIYNFPALRNELESHGHRFRGRSDTEVMLAAFEQWGVREATGRFNGMFAFAVWDRTRQALYLARDRLGEKPLYYGWCGKIFFFGSELKALRAHPSFRDEVDRGALALYLRHNYIPCPYSIYRGIFKLLPGSTLAVLPAHEGGSQAPVPFWDAREVAARGLQDPVKSEAEALEELACLLTECVRMRMVSDVPLGAFLSGGIDSSLVVSLMQAASASPVKTFTIGFWEPDYDEAACAKDVARHLGTEHTELYVTPAKAMRVIQKLPEMFDEPFADSSQIPTFLISELTRRHVTVSLSGDGGDELFGGYTTYLANSGFWHRYGSMPVAARRLLAGVADLMSDGALGFAAAPLDWISGRKDEKKNSTRVRLRRLAAALSQTSEETVYMALLSRWDRPAEVLSGATEPPTAFTDPGRWARLPSFLYKMMYLDMVAYLPDDILAKVDRASMAVSLEGRCPMLDHRLVEFAWRIPAEMKIRGQEGKWPLRQILHKFVPRTLVDRPKTGFSIPISAWLRGPLRDWTEELLSPGRLRNDGFFNLRPVHEKWSEHKAGVEDWGSQLWGLLMFQAWLESQRNTN
jgi:asparagine synthase (glutamine-hydrolysing)